MADMTPTQAKYISYIHAYTEGFGYPPAESEIAKAIKVSGPSVNQMLKVLVEKKLIKKTPGKTRSIVVLVPASEIPKWKSSRLISTRKVWMFDPKKAAKAAASKAATSKSNSGKSISKSTDTEKAAPAPVYRLKIVLKESSPAIWRRIEVQDLTLIDLHLQIQCAMGWTDSHLFVFRINESYYTRAESIDSEEPEEGVMPAESVKLSELIKEHGGKLKMNYLYDFGDGWEHEVKLEKVIEAEPRVKYPRCTDGECACPPEDIGGIDRFYYYVDAIGDKTHEQYGEYLEVYGRFNPYKFSAKSATKDMQSARHWR